MCESNYIPSYNFVELSSKKYHLITKDAVSKHGVPISFFSVCTHSLFPFRQSNFLSLPRSKIQTVERNTYTLSALMLKDDDSYNSSKPVKHNLFF